MTSAFLPPTTTPDMDVMLTPLSTALATMNSTLTTMNTTLAHPVYFPYPLAPTLHAARISIAFQIGARKSPAPLSWGTYIVGYLITVCRVFAILLCSHFYDFYIVLGRWIIVTFPPRPAPSNAVFVPPIHHLHHCTPSINASIYSLPICTSPQL